MMGTAITAGNLRSMTGVFCLTLSFSCVAQQAAVGAEHSAELTPNPLLAMRAFEAPANEAYTLGRGDELSIDFPGRPELSVKRVVGPDGRVTLPPAGSVVIVDKTREEAASVIADSFSRFYKGLDVTVGVDKYTSNRVLLLGAVEHPGMVSFDAPPTLLELFTIGGGVYRQNQVNTIPLPEGSGQLLRVPGANIAYAVPEQCAIYRGSEQVMWVDLKGLLDAGNTLADLRLKRGDVVYVPAASERYVSVLGQVSHPGALLLDRNTTLTKLLAQAGGITQLAGKNPNIQVVSKADGKSRIVQFKTLLQPGELDLTLKSGDVIYVMESGFNSAAYVLEKLSPLISIFTTGALLGIQR